MDNPLSAVTTCTQETCRKLGRMATQNTVAVQLHLLWMQSSVVDSAVDRSHRLLPLPTETVQACQHVLTLLPAHTFELPAAAPMQHSKYTLPAAVLLFSPQPSHVSHFCATITALTFASAKFRDLRFSGTSYNEMSALWGVSCRAHRRRCAML